MTPQQVEQNIGKKVYGLSDEDMIEEFTLVSAIPPDKKGSPVRQMTLQPAKGDPFRAGIGDFFPSELEALLLASGIIDDLIDRAEEEIESLKTDIAKYKKQQQKAARRIQKLEHLAKVGVASKKS